jgi:DNA-binding PadR family transcriptional regulator
MQRTRTAYVILGMLSIAPHLSGYEIHKAIEDNFGSFWGESYGQIYPSLKRLLSEGLIEARKPDSGQQRRRQEYSLTDAGRVCLREWLALPFQNDPPRNEFMLKLFFAGEAAPGVALAHVRELQRRNQQMMATLEGIEQASQRYPSDSPNKPYWMLTLSLGMALTRAALEWGESTLAQLSASEAPGPRSPKPAKTMDETNPA